MVNNGIDNSEVLLMDILPGRGVGEICLGMDATSFIEKFIDSNEYYHQKNIKIGALFPDLYFYCFQDSVKVFIDIQTAKVVKIFLTNKYSGKYKGIGIGDKIGRIKEIEDDLSIDDDYVTLKDCRTTFVADDDLTSTVITDDQIDNCRIESIIIKL